MNGKNKHLVGNRVTIYQRGKRGVYQADFHDRGQHRRQSLKTSCKKIALKRATLIAAQLEEGSFGVKSQDRPPAADGISLDKARLQYKAFKVSEDARPKTVVKEDGILRNFIAFAATKDVTRLDQLTLTLIDGFRQMRSQVRVRGRKLSPKQKHHDVSALRRFFTWCHDRKMLAENPLANHKLKAPSAKRKRLVLTLAQFIALLAATPKRILGPIAVLAMGGMRSENCRQLLVTDVDFESGWIYVRSVEGATTKEGNEWKVPMHPRLRRILMSLPRRSSGYYFTARPSKKYPAGGHWINTKHLNEDFKKILVRLGLPAGKFDGFTVHDLRHFFKSVCIAHGVPRDYVDAWQGHANPRTASDLYVHTFDSESIRLMNQVPFGDGALAANAG